MSSEQEYLQKEADFLAQLIKDHKARTLASATLAQPAVSSYRSTQEYPQGKRYTAEEHRTRYRTNKFSGSNKVDHRKSQIVVNKEKSSIVGSHPLQLHGSSANQTKHPINDTTMSRDPVTTVTSNHRSLSSDLISKGASSRVVLKPGTTTLQRNDTIVLGKTAKIHRVSYDVKGGTQRDVPGHKYIAQTSTIRSQSKEGKVECCTRGKNMDSGSKDGPLSMKTELKTTNRIVIPPVDAVVNTKPSIYKQSQKAVVKKSNTNVVQTTEKIENAQNILLQIRKAMSEGYKPQQHHKKDDRDIAQKVSRKPQPKSQGRNKYKYVRPESSVPKKRVDHDPSLSINIFDISNAPSPIWNASASWPGQSHASPRVSTPTHRGFHTQYNNVANKSASSDRKKYKFVRGQDSSAVTSINQSPLPSLTKSPSMVVKLRTKYKLVKKAKQTRAKRYSYKSMFQRRSKSSLVNQSFSGTPNSSSRQLSPGKVWTKKYSLARDNSQTMTTSSHRKLFNTYEKYRLSRYPSFTSYRGYPQLRQIRRNSCSRNKWRQSMFRKSNMNTSRTFGKSYRSASNKLERTITVRGESRFLVGKKGKSLRRVCKEKYSFSNVSKLKSGVPKPPTSTQVIATRALQRSIFTASYAKHKLKRNKTREFCKFYNRFGRCSRGAKCKFIHDPKRIALCTRFLRGTCKVTDCPFSHDVSAEKMPVCSYFLKGICNRDKCPYSHVKVSMDAEPCPDFMSGYCPLGNNCRKRHTLLCPEFQKTGQCSKGKRCPLKHPVKAQKRKRSESASSTTRKGQATKKTKNKSGPAITSVDDINVPFKDRTLPSFISLATSNASNVDSSANLSAVDVPSNSGKSVKQPMLIKPRF